MKKPISTDWQELHTLAQRLRCEVLDMTTRYAGHPSSCFSATEILTVLYFSDILRYRPQQPHWPERDRFILSKGHAAPLLYAVLAHAGYFPVSALQKFRELDSGFHGHPVQTSLPGVEVTSGSLGQGLSFALGMILAGRLQKRDYHVYALLGDGECEEGQIWEAAMAAAHYRADQLIAIVDHNKYQQTGPIDREMSLAPFKDKWQAFGWHVEETDGHDLASLYAAFKRLHSIRNQPSVLIAHTIKGKGVGFMEKDYTFHGKPLTLEQKALAQEEILCN